MATGIPIGSDFREKITPHLAVLLRFSLWLTKDGKTATRLLRESLAEALRTWDVTVPEEGYLRLHTILRKRFDGPSEQTSITESPEFTTCGITSGVGGIIPPFETCADPAGVSWLASEREDEVDYLKTISEFPPVLRSAMILSYIEGFSANEIATLANVGPIVVESLLDRGRYLLQAQLYEQLMDEDIAFGPGDGNEASN